MRRDDFDWDCLNQYAQKLDRSSVLQRLGFLLELYDLSTASLITALQAMIGSHYVRLDLFLPEEGSYQVRWQLRLNLEPQELKTIIRP